MYELLKDNAVLSLIFLSGGGLSFVIGLLAKMIKKEKLKPSVLRFAKLVFGAINGFTLMQLGKAAAEKFEEGMIITLIDLGIYFLEEGKKILRSDHGKS